MTRDELKKLLRTEELDDIKTVASTAAGRRLLARVFHQANIFTVLPPENPLVMAFNEGQRNVGLMAMNDLLEACPEKLLTIRKAIEERRERYGKVEARSEDEEDSDFWNSQV